MSTRFKKFKRTLNFYRINFQIHPPYKIIADPEFLRHAIEKNIEIDRLIVKVLDAPASFCITKCTRARIRKTRMLGDLAKHQMEVVNCEHSHDKPLFVTDCFKDFTKAKPLYCIACQNEERRKEISQTVPGVPLIHINKQNVIMLDSPSRLAMEFVSQRGFVQRTAHLTTDIVKQVEEAQKEQQPIITKKKQATINYIQKQRKEHGKKAKGPNPLSCKKKKKKTNNNNKKTNNNNNTTTTTK